MQGNDVLGQFLHTRYLYGHILPTRVKAKHRKLLQRNLVYRISQEPQAPPPPDQHSEHHRQFTVQALSLHCPKPHPPTDAARAPWRYVVVAACVEPYSCPGHLVPLPNNVWLLAAPREQRGGEDDRRAWTQQQQQSQQQPQSQQRSTAVGQLRPDPGPPHNVPAQPQSQPLPPASKPASLSGQWKLKSQAQRYTPPVPQPPQQPIKKIKLKLKRSRLNEDQTRPVVPQQPLRPQSREVATTRSTPTRNEHATAASTATGGCTTSSGPAAVASGGAVEDDSSSAIQSFTPVVRGAGVQASVVAAAEAVAAAAGWCPLPRDLQRRVAGSGSASGAGGGGGGGAGSSGSGSGSHAGELSSHADHTAGGGAPAAPGMYSRGRPPSSSSTGPRGLEGWGRGSGGGSGAARMKVLGLSEQQLLEVGQLRLLLMYSEGVSEKATRVSKRTAARLESELESPESQVFNTFPPDSVVSAAVLLPAATADEAREEAGMQWRTLPAAVLRAAGDGAAASSSCRMPLRGVAGGTVHLGSGAAADADAACHNVASATTTTTTTGAVAAIAVTSGNVGAEEGLYWTTTLGAVRQASTPTPTHPPQVSGPPGAPPPPSPSPSSVDTLLSATQLSPAVLQVSLARCRLMVETVVEHPNTQVLPGAQPRPMMALRLLPEDAAVPSSWHTTSGTSGARRPSGAHSPTGTTTTTAVGETSGPAPRPPHPWVEVRLGVCGWTLAALRHLSAERFSLASGSGSGLGSSSRSHHHAVQGDTIATTSATEGTVTVATSDAALHAQMMQTRAPALHRQEEQQRRWLRRRQRLLREPDGSYDAALDESFPEDGLVTWLWHAPAPPPTSLGCGGTGLGREEEGLSSHGGEGGGASGSGGGVGRGPCGVGERGGGRWRPQGPVLSQELNEGLGCLVCEEPFAYPSPTCLLAHIRACHGELDVCLSYNRTPAAALPLGSGAAAGSAAAAAGTGTLGDGQPAPPASVSDLTVHLAPAPGAQPWWDVLQSLEHEAVERLVDGHYYVPPAGSAVEDDWMVFRGRLRNLQPPRGLWGEGEGRAIGDREEEDVANVVRAMVLNSSAGDTGGPATANAAAALAPAPATATPITGPTTGPATATAPASPTGDKQVHDASVAPITQRRSDVRNEADLASSPYGAGATPANVDEDVKLPTAVTAATEPLIEADGAVWLVSDDEDEDEEGVVEVVQLGAHTAVRGSNSAMAGGRGVVGGVGATSSLAVATAAMDALNADAVTSSRQPIGTAVSNAHAAAAVEGGVSSPPTAAAAGAGGARSEPDTTTATVSCAAAGGEAGPHVPATATAAVAAATADGAIAAAAGTSRTETATPCGRKRHRREGVADMDVDGSDRDTSADSDKDGPGANATGGNGSSASAAAAITAADSGIQQRKPPALRQVVPLIELPDAAPLPPRLYDTAGGGVSDLRRGGRKTLQPGRLLYTREPLRELGAPRYERGPPPAHEGSGVEGAPSGHHPFSSVDSAGVECQDMYDDGEGGGADGDTRTDADAGGRPTPDVIVLTRRHAAAADGAGVGGGARIDTNVRPSNSSLSGLGLGHEDSRGEVETGPKTAPAAASPWQTTNRSRLRGRTAAAAAASRSLAVAAAVQRRAWETTPLGSQGPAAAAVHPSSQPGRATPASQRAGGGTESLYRTPSGSASGAAAIRASAAAGLRRSGCPLPAGRRSGPGPRRASGKGAAAANGRIPAFLTPGLRPVGPGLCTDFSARPMFVHSRTHEPFSKDELLRCFAGGLGWGGCAELPDSDSDTADEEEWMVSEVAHIRSGTRGPHDTEGALLPPSARRTQAEVTFFALWNRFGRRHPLHSDRCIPTRCEAFVSGPEGAEIAACPDFPTLRRKLVAHLAMLWEHALVDPVTMARCLQQIDQRRRQHLDSIASATTDHGDRSPIMGQR